MKNPDDILASPATVFGAITLGFTTLGVVWHFMSRDRDLRAPQAIPIPAESWVDQGETPDAYTNLRVGSIYTTVLDVPESPSSVFSRYDKTILGVATRESGGKVYVTITPRAPGKDAIALWQYEDDITWMRILPVRIVGAPA